MEAQLRLQVRLVTVGDRDHTRQRVKSALEGHRLLGTALVPARSFPAMRHAVSRAAFSSLRAVIFLAPSAASIRQNSSCRGTASSTICLRRGGLGTGWAPQRRAAPREVKP